MSKNNLLSGIENKSLMKVTEAAGKLEDYSYLDRVIKNMGVGSVVYGKKLTLSNRVRYVMLSMLTNIPMYTNSGDLVYSIERCPEDSLVFVAVDKDGNKNLIIDFRKNKKGDMYYVIEKYTVPTLLRDAEIIQHDHK